MDKKDYQKIVNQLGRTLKIKSLDPIDKKTLYNVRLKYYNEIKDVKNMDHDHELQLLEKDNATNGNLTVNIYKNKAALLERISENADDPKAIYTYMQKELDHLADNKKIYRINTGNGIPLYYDDAKEAYDSI